MRRLPGASRVFRPGKRRRLALDFDWIVAGRDKGWVGKSEKIEKSAQDDLSLELKASITDTDA